MFTRIFGVLILMSGLTLATVGMARAGGMNHGLGGPGGSGDPSAPELDPTALGSGLAMLAGGVLLMTERRRKNK